MYAACVVLCATTVSHCDVWAVTGRPVGADEAKTMGLANRVVPPGQGLAAAQALAADIAKLYARVWLWLVSNTVLTCARLRAARSCA